MYLFASAVMQLIAAVVASDAASKAPCPADVADTAIFDCPRGQETSPESGLPGN